MSFFIKIQRRFKYVVFLQKFRGVLNMSFFVKKSKSLKKAILGQRPASASPSREPSALLQPKIAIFHI
jgi:hypothetical protein